MCREDSLTNHAAEIARFHPCESCQRGSVGGSNLVAQDLRIDVAPGKQTRSSKHRLGREAPGNIRREIGRDAGITARFAGDALVKVSVLLLSPDSNGQILQLVGQEVARGYGTPAEQRGVSTIWRERNGTLVWVTISEDRHVTAHYEAAAWPAESRRRRGQ